MPVEALLNLIEVIGMLGAMLLGYVLLLNGEKLLEITVDLLEALSNLWDRWWKKITKKE